MTETQFDELSKAVSRLRRAIDRAKAEYPDQNELPFINHWPKNCCDAPFLFDMLYELGYRGMTRKCADVSHLRSGFEKHVWIMVEGITIDITADQFPGVNEKVIFGYKSSWHDALPLIEERPWAEDGEEELYRRHVKTEAYLAYEKILPMYA